MQLAADFHSTRAQPISRQTNKVISNLVTSGHAAGGGGIATQFSAVALANTIINSNFADGATLDGGTGMYALDSLLEAANTVVQYNGCGALGAGLLLSLSTTSTLTKNLPLLTEVCRTALSGDIDNEPRGEVPDLGADEYVEVLPAN